MSMIGHNAPDVTADIQSRLRMDYANLADALAEHQEAARTIPPEATTKEDHDLAADLVAKIRTSYKTVEAQRVAEKEPYLKGERAIDGFFEPLKKALTELGQHVAAIKDGYLKRKADEERRVREEAARIEREKAEALRREEAAARAAQELAQRKAEEARRADHRKAAALEAARLAGEAENAAALARNAETVADDAEQFAKAKPADLARTRTDRGTLSTLKSVWVGKIEDMDAIPLEILRPYIPAEIVEKAVNAFVKNGGRQLPGVRIYETEKGMTR